jgi:Papain family cysteine protease
MQAASIKGFKQVQGEASMQQTLESVGPLSVGIRFSPDLFKYESGIFNNPKCLGTSYHAVS